MFDISDKTVLITGGSGILGRSIAAGLAKAGARVAVMGRNLDKAQKVAAGIRNDGGSAIAVAADVMDTESLLRARDCILDEFGTLDVLINGAGGNRAEATTGEDYAFFDIPLEALREVVDLNFTGAVRATQVFGRILTDKKKGSVINISSMAAITPLTRTVAYSAAKAAVSNFTQWMAVHFNREYSTDLRVNAVAPGFFLTEQNRYLLTDRESGQPTERGRRIIEATPMGRYGRPEELVGIVTFLCSEASSFINGTIIPVDGGFSAFSGV